MSEEKTRLCDDAQCDADCGSCEKAASGIDIDKLNEEELKTLCRTQSDLVKALVDENETLIKEQEELNKKIEKGNGYLDQLAHMKSDFENYKRRTNAAKDNSKDEGKIFVIEKILPGYYDMYNPNTVPEKEAFVDLLKDRFQQRRDFLSTSDVREQPELFRNNLNPVAIRIFNEVNSHLRILIADTSHLLMLFMGRFHIICCKCQVNLIISQIVPVLFPISQPGQFQLKPCLSVSQINKHKASVSCFFSPHWFKSKSLSVKVNGFIQVHNVVIIMSKLKFHVIFFLLFFSIPKFRLIE